MKNFNLKNYIKPVPIIALSAFIILNLYIGYAMYNKSNNILRLHVVANSNSSYDQLTKLKVNEKVEEYISSLYNGKNLSSKEKINLLKQNSENILQIANDTLNQNNTNYKATLQIGKIQYDKKDSALISMDEGVYSSLKIVLGKGEGKNIWSFIFPDEKSIENLKYYETIMPNISKIYGDNEDNVYIYKSKILEIIKNN